MSLFFGYTSFVKGECAAATYLHYREGLEPMLQQAMYEKLAFQQFVKYGINRLYTAAEPYYLPIKGRYPGMTKEDFYACTIYFYNRQLIVQMFMIPTPFQQKLQNQQLAKPVYIPIYRDIGLELQADIMMFTRSQQEFNYERKYLLVIVDPLTRYCWAMPVQTLQSNRVLKALASALSRPGIGKTFYEKIFHEQCKLFTVDGGSEFKDLFQEHYQLLFPNAILRNSEAKWRTGGRPTLTGPIEACIRTLRKTIRDYEIGYEKTFLSPDEEGKTSQKGLDQILNTYNQQAQTTTLHSFSPEQMVRSILIRRTHQLEEEEKEPEEIANVSHILDHVNFVQSFVERTETKRKEKIRQQREQKQHIFEDILSPNMEEYGLRKKQKEATPGFVKEIHYRVSLVLYRFIRYDLQYPNFCYIRPEDAEEQEANVERVLLRELVVVKTPIFAAPHSIVENLRKEFNHQQDRPQRPYVAEPFPVSNVITRMLENHPNRQVQEIFQRRNYERPRMNPVRPQRGEMPAAEPAAAAAGAGAGIPPRQADIYARYYPPQPRVRGLARLRPQLLE